MPRRTRSFRTRPARESRLFAALLASSEVEGERAGRIDLVLGLVARDQADLVLPGVLQALGAEVELPVRLVVPDEVVALAVVADLDGRGLVDLGLAFGLELKRDRRRGLDDLLIGERPVRRDQFSAQRQDAAPRDVHAVVQRLVESLAPIRRSRRRRRLG